MDFILEDKPAERVLRLRLNRPEIRNALSLEMRATLASRIAIADADTDTRVVIIAGSEKAFAAGADINGLVDIAPIDVHRLGHHRIWQSIAGFSKPLIAAVRGYALGGGCELAMHADIIVAGRGATFGLPEVRVGIMPGAGGTQRLVRAIGKYRAMRLLLTGELIKATVAAEWGLVSELVDDEKVDEAAVTLASRIAEGPVHSLEAIKEAVLQGADLPLSAALMLERKSMQILFGTHDQKEGMAAFRERRQPRFE